MSLERKLKKRGILRKKLILTGLPITLVSDKNMIQNRNSLIFNPYLVLVSIKKKAIMAKMRIEVTEPRRH